jgi:hypothetical protein
MVETLNGMMPASSNEFARRAASERGLAAVGGSDAHAAGSIARTFTTVPRAKTREEFLAGLRAGLTVPAGSSGSYARLVADVSTIFLCALAESVRGCLTGPRERARLAALIALLPGLALLPAIALANFVREAQAARALGDRYFEVYPAGPDRQPAPLSTGSGAA